MEFDPASECVNRLEPMIDYRSLVHADWSGIYYGACFFFSGEGR